MKRKIIDKWVKTGSWEYTFFLRMRGMILRAEVSLVEPRRLRHGEEWQLRITLMWHFSKWGYPRRWAHVRLMGLKEDESYFPSYGNLAAAKRAAKRELKRIKETSNV